MVFISSRFIRDITSYSCARTILLGLQRSHKGSIPGVAGFTTLKKFFAPQLENDRSLGQLPCLRGAEALIGLAMFAQQAYN